MNKDGKTIRVLKEDINNYISNGYQLGYDSKTLESKRLTAKKNVKNRLQINRVWVNNGSVEKLYPANQLLPDGFGLGRLGFTRL